MIFLQLRLAILFSLFLARIAWEMVVVVRTTLLSLIAGIVITWVLIAHLVSPSTLSGATIFPAIDSRAPENSLVQLTEAQIREKIIENQRVLYVQPTHRDILLNTAQLHLALGEIEQSEHYLLQARLLDPNHPAFKSN